MDPRLAAAALRQPDARSCGAATLVMHRAVTDPAYAELLLTGTHPGTGHRLGGSVQERFTEEVLAMHRRTTSPVDVSGAAQIPWPRKFGTPPWAIAHQLAGSTGTPWTSRTVSPWSRGEALDALRDAVADRPVPLYVGSRWLPRHVVLVLDPGLRVYEPAGGHVVRITGSAFRAGKLKLAGWAHPWLVVLPGRR